MNLKKEITKISRQPPQSKIIEECGISTFFST
jgi:hypothetical protein